MDRMVVNGLQAGLEADRPAQGTRPPAQVHVLVIEEEIVVQTTEFAETLAAQKKTTAGYPRNPAAPPRMEQMVLAPLARQNQPGKALHQRGKRTGRELTRAVAVTQLETDDADLRVRSGQGLGQGEHTVKKIGRHTNTGTQQ